MNCDLVQNCMIQQTLHLSFIDLRLLGNQVQVDNYIVLVLQIYFFVPVALVSIIRQF